jgi:hypothetical protein
MLRGLGRMKIYCVIDNVDLGYNVEYASTSKDKANEVLVMKLQEKRQKFYTTYEMIELEVEE